MPHFLDRRGFIVSTAASAGALALPRVANALSAAIPRATAALAVNGARLNAHLTALAEFGKNPQGGVSRFAYSESNKQAMPYVMGLMRDAGLDVSIDAAGNIIGRRAGNRPSLKPILFGSHIDSVPEGGNYDGTLGSLGAIEVAQTLNEAKLVTQHPLEVVIWQNEEGGLYGSIAATDGLSEAELAAVSHGGKTIREGIAFLGGNPDNLASVLRKKGDVFAYLELHIEQGATLYEKQLEIGVVEGIVGVRRYDVTVTGVANHAGTTAMANRHDALLTAARFVDAVNRIMRAEPGRQVATVGRIQAFPGAANVVPGKVTLSLDMRDLDEAKLDTLFSAITASAAVLSAANGTTFAFEQVNHHIAALTAPSIQRLVAASAQQLGLTSMSLPSGAGHDAQSMAKICPMAMIFVPSVDGISHAPTEYSTPKACEDGANVLLQTLLRLDTATL